MNIFINNPFLLNLTKSNWFFFFPFSEKYFLRYYIFFIIKIIVQEYLLYYDWFLNKIIDPINDNIFITSENHITDFHFL